MKAGRVGSADRGGPASRLSSVDWSELHARIENVGRVLAAGRSMSLEDEARILAERARALARPPATGEEEPGMEVLTLALGGWRCALETRFVIEVVRQPPVAPLPGAVAPVAAVAAWRGRILTTLDLRGSPSVAWTSGENSAPHLLVVIGQEQAELGLLAETVESVTTMRRADLRPLPDSAMSWRTYLCAITDDATPILDGGAILRHHHADG